MSNNSIIEHRGNYFYIEFREEYLAICLNCSYKKLRKSKASPYCKALILAILESWTNDKRGKGQDLAIYMTYPQWIDAMYGMFGRTAIIDSIDELLGEGLLSREKHKMYGKDTYKYLLNYKELNRRIKLLPEKDPKHTRPQVNASTSKRDNSSEPSTSKRESRPQVDEDASTSGRNIESTKKPNIESKEGTYGNGNSVNPETSLSSTPSLSSLSEKSERLTQLIAEATRLQEEITDLASESAVEHLSTPDVDKQANSVDNPQLPIANPTTENATQKSTEPLATGNASTTPNVRRDTEPLLSAEGKLVRDYWCELGYEDRGTSTSHWNTLSKHIRSLEQMDSLFKHTQTWVNDNPRITDKQVHPGNLVHCLNGWKQAQTPLPTKPTKQKVKITQEYLDSLPV